MLTKETRNGQTRSGLYSLFIPMEWNYEGYIDSYGTTCIRTHQKNQPKDHLDGEIIEGVIEYWENEVEGLKRRSRWFK